MLAGSGGSQRAARSTRPGTGRLHEHGRDPATRQLAEEIIAAQTIEIESMTRRLAALRKPSGGGAAGEFPSLGGTRGP